MTALVLRGGEVDGRRVDVLLADGRIVAARGRSAAGGTPRRARRGGASGAARAARPPPAPAGHGRRRGVARPLAGGGRSRKPSAGPRARSRPGRWVRATGFVPSAVDLDRARLDDWAGAVPVRVQDASGALWILNWAALTAVAAAGVAFSDEERCGAGSCRGDERLGGAWPEPDLHLAEVGAALAAHGVTGVTDATPFTDPGGPSRLAAAVADGSIPQRVVLTGAPVLTRSRTTSPGGRPRWSSATTTSRRFAALVAAIDRAHRDGRPVAVHCVTAEALALLLAAWAEVGASRATGSSTARSSRRVPSPALAGPRRHRRHPARLRRRAGRPLPGRGRPRRPARPLALRHPARRWRPRSAAGPTPPTARPTRGGPWPRPSTGARPSGARPRRRRAHRRPAGPSTSSSARPTPPAARPVGSSPAPRPTSASSTAPWPTPSTTSPPSGSPPPSSPAGSSGPDRGLRRVVGPPGVHRVGGTGALSDASAATLRRRRRPEGTGRGSARLPCLLLRLGATLGGATGGWSPTAVRGNAMATAVAPQSPTFERIATPAPVLVTMATLSAAAAVIHLVMVPSHMDEFAAEGVAFAVAGLAPAAGGLLPVDPALPGPPRLHRPPQRWGSSGCGPSAGRPASRSGRTAGIGRVRLTRGPHRRRPRRRP